MTTAATRPATAYRMTVQHRDERGNTWTTPYLQHDRDWLADYGEHLLAHQDSATSYSIAPVDVVTVDLPLAFYDDHANRDLPSGVVIKRLARSIRVALDTTAYDDLLSDAQHYADPVNGYAAEYPGLVASARATVRRLQAADRPADDEPAPWADDAADIAAAVADITAASREMDRHSGATGRISEYTAAAKRRSRAWLRYGDAVHAAMAKGAQASDLPLLTANDGVRA